MSTLQGSGIGLVGGIISVMLTASGYKVPEGMSVIRLYKGRPYFNMTAMQWAMYDSMGMLPSKVNENFGGHQPEIPVPDPNPLKGKDGLKRRARQMRFGLYFMRTLMKSKSILGKALEEAEAKSRKNYSQFSDEALVAELCGVLSIKGSSISDAIILAMGATIQPELLRRELKRHFPGREGALANGLMAGGSGITSAEHGYELLKLADMARDDKEALSFFTAEDFQPLTWRERLPLNSNGDPNFRSHFEEFLEQYGHRAVYEGDFKNPRWREDPTYLLEFIRNQIQNPVKVNYKEMQRMKREQAQQEIKEKLGLRPSRLKINYLTKLAVKSVAKRELLKSIGVKSVEPLRLLYEEVGSRLAARGLLNERADVYHCAMIELLLMLDGIWDGRGLKLLVEERKEKFKEYEQLDPPDVIIDEIPQPKAAVQEVSGEVFEGIGVAAGQATGAARLINHPNEGNLLKPGEILVAPSTDPGWTPLFLRASGLIMEVGGSFSHGAIVAREYGIPAVVNVPGAMKVLQDGEIVTVDGDEGKIYRSVRVKEPV